MRSLSIIGLLLVFGIPAARAQDAVKTSLPDSLVKQAKVPEAMARRIAHTKAPKGTITEVELEREKGHLQYSYDIKVPGQKGVTEVNVDAMTGKVVNVEHEDDAGEAKEAPKTPKAKTKS